MNEEKARLTPKGFLKVEMMSNRNIDSLWDRLTEFVARQAAQNGMENGIPCLVLKDGGHCITAEETPEEQQ